MTAMATASMSLPDTSADAQPLERRWVAKLFDRLASQLGSKLADLYAGSHPEKVQQEWARGLAGFAPAEIARGLAACSERQFAPVLGEFKQLCRPALDPEFAWHEAQDGLQERAAGRVGVWSHPGVWRAARRMQHELRTGSFSQHRKRWQMILGRELAAGWGEEVAAPAPLIEHNPTLMAIPSDLRAKLADLGKKFSVKG